jgi:hypothetical protein
VASGAHPRINLCPRKGSDHSTLLRARKRTAHNKWFVPAQKLRQILDRDAVSNHIDTCEIPLHNRDGCIELVLTSATAVFGILVCVRQEVLIMDFISNELLDNKLPLTRSDIEGIDVNEQFFIVQSEFISPVFSKRSIILNLKDECVLPFLEDARVGDGGYGNAYRVSLDPLHQDLEKPPVDGSVSFFFNCLLFTSFQFLYHLFVLQNPLGVALQQNLSV